MRPASGAISPASCPIKVVLPAPFGPMIACNSPLRTPSEIASDAMTPPNRLVRPSISSSVSTRASVTACPRQQAVDAATREQHDQQEQVAEHDLPVFGHPHGGVSEQGERRGPDHD